MLRTYVGIDNGISGAMAAMVPDSSVAGGWRVMTTRTPTLKVGDVELVDIMAAKRWLVSVGPLENMHVIMEAGQKQPVFGIKGNFSTGFSYGAFFSFLRLMGVAASIINPKNWQNDMFRGLSARMKTDTKACSIEMCRRLFPRVSLIATERCTKDHDGIADALCMAEWGRRNNL